MKPLKEKISITIDSDLLKRLKKLSEEDDRSLSQYINVVLKKHIESIDDDNKWKSGCNFFYGGSHYAIFCCQRDL